MNRLYLYLASRSKQGIKLITVLQSEETVNASLESVTQLDLPATWRKKIEQIIHEHRMLYEPRMQTASNYEELKMGLRAKGFANIPSGVCPLLHFKAYSSAPIANISSCKVCKTMLRKK